MKTEPQLLLKHKAFVSYGEMAGGDALGIASLVLAAPPILEPTLNCVKYILDVSNAYQKADQLHQDSLLQLDVHLYQVQQFARFLQENFQTLDDDTRSLCKRLVAVIETRLIDLVSVLSSITDPSGKINKLEYTIKGRDAITRLCTQLEAWEGSLNTVLFAYILSSRCNSPSLSLEVSPISPKGQTRWQRTAELMRNCLNDRQPTSLELSPAAIDDKNFTPVMFSSVRWRGHPGPSLIESHNSTASEEEVKDIATFLSKADESVVSILKCQGYNGHTLLFQLPQMSAEPRSLQKVLVDAYSTLPTHDLAERLELMKKIATSILFIHTADHVHKSIRTSNILLLDMTPKSLGKPYLVGFDLSRKSIKSSRLTKTPEWWNAYYVAPDRQGDTNRAYTLLDDVYSFGVVLLELSLWRSFARWRKSSKPPYELKWSRGSDMLRSEAGSTLPLNPEQLKQKFVQLAKETVPVKLGLTMSKLIVSCLTCLDDDGMFKDQRGSNGSDGSSLGIKYIKEVILQLELIKL
ncbi:het-s domain protein [Fusarium beomiforme]|uniref:Het-s domain protein n=1 Tax=Fusarium beomiforme TaxID=44412 RepID=A0A9P5E120_9HYPO|nr:het-s domain protein [Fusarium beomiforme]